MPTPQQIHDDLRPHLRGTVRVDELARQLHSTDASPFQILPVAVVVPADEDDVRRVVKYAYEQGVPVVPRGAGTGLAGQCLTPGIVLDLSVHFRRIEAIGPDWVRVQPGVTLSELNAELAKQGRRFGPEMSNAAVATLGGMIATNAGVTRDHVSGLKLMWSDGEIAEVKCSKFKVQSENGVESGMHAAVRELILANPEAVRTPCQGGYPLHELLYHDRVDLVRLLVGSEGTLAITLEATLKTVPLVGGTAVFVLGFPSLDDALAAGLSLRDHEGLSKCELLDQRLLSLARSQKNTLPVPGEVVSALIVRFEADSESVAEERANAAFASLHSETVLAISEPVVDVARRRRIDAFREAGIYGFHSISGGRRPEAFLEDVAVPVAELMLFIARTQQLLRDADLTASFHVNVLTGQVQCRPIVDLTDRTDQAKAWPLADAVHSLAMSLGGSISSRHGIGLARTPWMEKQAGSLYPLFREIKRIFDPRNILNPGKIVGPDPSRPAWPFRSRVQGPVVSDLAKPAEPISLLTLETLASEVSKCNACGDCRVRSNPSRMCPLFRVTGEEDATPRAKANLLRSVFASEDPNRIEADDVKAVAKLCIQCGQCKDECKAGVDIPHLMLETKGAHYAAHGFDRHEWLIARSERLSGVAGTFAFTANILLGITPTRWLFEKLFGLSRKRMLHRYTHRTFLRRRLVQRFYRRLPTGPKKLAYFVDTFANFNDPLLAEATVAVLEHHGFVVHVPRRQRGSGMPALSVGDLDTARARAAYNVPPLAELVRDGYTIVCSEPSAALALTQEYPRLLVDDDDAKLVAANTVELTALLNDLRTRGELKPISRQLSLHVGHHVPCQLKSLGQPIATQQLLESIPGLSVQTIDVGCSGVAGIWGFSKSNFDMSMQIGEPVFAALKDVAIHITTSECSSCRMQLQQGTGKRALHPVQLLALGYGLMPQLESKLNRPLHPRLTG
ncbi:FAD-binding and (Fe-S)-binding domain-containing protein [soil metagenome]